MSINDTGTIIAIVIAVAAFVSPIVVAVVNNVHQTKMKKIEILSDFKLKAIENYMRCLCNCHNNNEKVDIEEYRKAFGTAMLYVSGKTAEQMMKINLALENDYEKDSTLSITTYQHFVDLCKSINEDIKIEKYT